MINLDEIGMMPIEIQKEIARKEKERRKRKGFTQEELAQRADVSLSSLRRFEQTGEITQEELAQRADVSLSSLRRFEQTGEISFASLVRIGSVLDDEKAFLGLFAPQDYQTMKELLDAKRGKG